MRKKKIIITVVGATLLELLTKKYGKKEYIQQLQFLLL